MRIEVTQDDITHGTKCECTHCPITLAIARELNVTIPSPDNDDYYIYVYNTFVRIGEERRILPLAATEFIRRFDKSLPVYPFEFELDYTP